MVSCLISRYNTTSLRQQDRFLRNFSWQFFIYCQNFFDRESSRNSFSNFTLTDDIFPSILPTPDLPRCPFDVESVWPFGPFISISPFELRHNVREGVETSILILSYKSNFLDFVVSDHVVPIVLSAQDYIAEVFDSSGTNYGLKISAFQSPSITIKEIRNYKSMHHHREVVSSGGCNAISI